MKIVSVNSLIEALKTKKVINKVFISKARKDKKKIDLILNLCKQNRVLFQMVPQGAIDKRAGQPNQGIFAELSPVKFYKLEEIMGDKKSGLILILDGINDAGNFGAIIRTAVGAQVEGIIIAYRKSVPVNDTVLKTSAGSLAHIKIVRSNSLINDIECLKSNGFWIVGTDIKGGLEYYKYDFKYKTAIIVGNENRGISPLLKKKSDYILSIPHSPQLDSLNVSVTTAIILFEAIRQKNI
jgi:23S rRNA (guanosine2251-2'-O)-methyltransferase